MAKTKSPKKSSKKVVSTSEPPAALTPDDLETENLEPDPEQFPVRETIRAEKPAPAPEVPEGHKTGDRVFLPDYGSRAGEIQQIDGDMLLVELDCPKGQDWAITQKTPEGKVIRTRLVEIESDRVKVEAGSRRAG